ncbi:hypothetical protein SLEP1_g38384 [Rubroshorea leprosula]|nr:hypothetical protein SLEP1_g38384 [Rubroshorea leprosula]
MIPGVWFLVCFLLLSTACSSKNKNNNEELYHQGGSSCWIFATIFGWHCFISEMVNLKGALSRCTHKGTYGDYFC